MYLTIKLHINHNYGIFPKLDLGQTTLGTTALQGVKLRLMVDEISAFPFLKGGNSVLIAASDLFPKQISVTRLFPWPMAVWRTNGQLVLATV